MTDHERNIDWRKTTFDGSRREQLRQAQAMTVRQRLEALDQLTELSERMQAMPRHTGAVAVTPGVHETQTDYHAGQTINEIVLAGCTPTPLANYLKALGVLRLLSEQHPETKAAWRNECLTLFTSLDKQEIENFFLHQYRPTPVMAPWNGGSGFYEKDNKTPLEAILGSVSERFILYRDCLHTAEMALHGMDRSSSPKGDAKATLLTRMRGLLPDDALGWLDAAVLLTGDSPQYPPLLGTGGNDGRLDFTNNFMQRLGEVLDLDTGTSSNDSAGWLKTALFGAASPGLVKKAIGQFSPGQAGGPNATAGFDADAAINPWDFILTIEGALLFAAAAARRNADDPYGVLSYPFTVRAVGAGSGSLGEGDTAAARGELWMPLWNQPVTYPEIRALLAEGRVALGKKPARDALDFIRAVHHLGGYRGIRSFQRYGLLMRSGKAYLATPLERVEVSDEPPTSILDDLDQHDWLAQFRRFAQGDNIANRFLTLRRRLETAFFDLSGQHPTHGEVQSLLVLLGEIQSALSNSKKAMESVPPIPRLSERWVQAADDGAPAFRIARALAGLHGSKDTPLPLRAQLFPVHPRFNTWMENARKAKGAGNDPACHIRIHTGCTGNLQRVLHTLLARRLWLAEQFDMDDKPLRSSAGVSLEDIVAFLRSDAMDRRIAALLPGLCLCEVPQDVERGAGDGAVPAAFGLLKLSLTPDRTLHSLDLLPESTRMPVPAGILAQLAAGNHGNRAVTAAWRRLRSSGLAPVFAKNALPDLGSIDPLRAAAALLIPLRYGATGALASSVLKTPNTESEAA